MLQNCIAAKNHSPVRQAKPCLTICGIIYLRHTAVGQQSHCSTSPFLKKRRQKATAAENSMQLDCLCSPHYATINSRKSRERNRKPYGKPTIYIKQQSLELRTLFWKLRRKLHTTFIQLGEKTQGKSSGKTQARSDNTGSTRVGEWSRAVGACARSKGSPCTRTCFPSRCAPRRAGYLLCCSTPQGSSSSNTKEFSLWGTLRSADERHDSRTRSDSDVYNYLCNLHDWKV